MQSPFFVFKPIEETGNRKPGAGSGQKNSHAGKTPYSIRCEASGAPFPLSELNAGGHRTRTK